MARVRSVSEVQNSIANDDEEGEDDDEEELDEEAQLKSRLRLWCQMLQVFIISRLKKA